MLAAFTMLQAYRKRKRQLLEMRQNLQRGVEIVEAFGRVVSRLKAWCVARWVSVESTGRGKCR